VNPVPNARTCFLAGVSGNISTFVADVHANKSPVTRTICGPGHRVTETSVRGFGPRGWCGGVVDGISDRRRSRNRRRRRLMVGCVLPCEVCRVRVSRRGGQMHGVWRSRLPRRSTGVRRLYAQTYRQQIIITIITIETLGPIDASAPNFLSEVGRRLTSLSGDQRETSFLFQRLSMLIQRFNSALIMDSCCSDEDSDL